ncbi:MAG: excinuclease ABC subunit UvrC [Crocinitomicaceae bacterium]|jgi:excinuclease ABC subunit C|nr:excinuclease ABC subunit UvrC [Crocinitomicaceae bacterium]
MTSHSELVLEKIKVLPSDSGVYQFFNKQGEIIYVGKAKNLSKRVHSYFKANISDGKTRALVKNIADVKFTVVGSELDALLLENNLIKSYRPRYNVLLKDDKTYPWIVVKNEPFPRIFSTRRKIKDGSRYFGPYPNGRVMHTLLQLIRELFTLRTCQLDLSPAKIQQEKYKVCLEYHIGKCKAPCIGQHSQESYQRMIESIELLLHGKTHALSMDLKKQMQEFSENYAFEEAHKIKEILGQIEKYQSKSMIVSPTVQEVDVLTFETDEDLLYFNYLVVREGAIVHTYTSHLELKLSENKTHVFSYVLPQLRSNFESSSKEVLVTEKMDALFPEFHFHCPQIGDKKRLIDLSENNVKHYRLQLKKREMNKVSEHGGLDALIELQQGLNLGVLPNHIECFDNSNLQGTNAVSSCVVFKNGVPSKSDYRHFNVKTVVGPDDFSTMKEVVFRRYHRLISEEQALPDLIIIDGGKGQLSAAMESIEELGISDRVQVFGLAKRMEELFRPNHSKPILLDRRSKGLKLVQHMRDEAHRFGITHHRNKRSKNSFNTELSEIKGIGEKTWTSLLKEFKTIENIKDANREEIAKKIGQAKMRILFDYFESK